MDRFRLTTRRNSMISEGRDWERSIGLWKKQKQRNQMELSITILSTTIYVNCTWKTKNQNNSKKTLLKSNNRSTGISLDNSIHTLINSDTMNVLVVDSRNCSQSQSQEEITLKSSRNSTSFTKNGSRNNLDMVNYMIQIGRKTCLKIQR